MIAAISQYLAQLDYGALVPQFGFGGVVLYVLTTWIKRIDAKIDDMVKAINHQTRALMIEVLTRPNIQKRIREEAQEIKNALGDD